MKIKKYELKSNRSVDLNSLKKSSENWKMKMNLSTLLEQETAILNS